MQIRIIDRAGIRLSNRSQIVAAGMPSQASGLAVPSSQRPDAIGLFLAKSIPEIVKEGVGVSLCQALNKFIAVFNKRSTSPLFV